MRSPILTRNVQNPANLGVPMSSALTWSLTFTLVYDLDSGLWSLTLTHILGLDRDAVVSDANLSLSVEHVRRTYNARVSFHLEAFNRLIVGLHQPVGDVAVRAGVKVDRSHLR